MSRQRKYVFSTEAPVKFTVADQKTYYGQRQYDTMLLMLELRYWMEQITYQPEEAQAQIDALWFALERVIPVGPKAAAVAKDAFKQGERSSVKVKGWVEHARNYRRRLVERKEPSELEKQLEKDRNDLSRFAFALMGWAGQIGQVRSEGKQPREQEERVDDYEPLDPDVWGDVADLQ